MNLVTGATGHIGNVLIQSLVEKGKRVRALVLPGEDHSALDRLPVEIVEGDILKPPTLTPVFESVSEVYHLAGMISIMPGKNELMRQVNVQGTCNVIAACRQAGVKRLVYTSSIHALMRPPLGVTIDESLPFDPHNPAGEYDRTKAEASLEVLKAVNEGLDAVIVCPTGVIGPYDYLQSEMGTLILDWMTLPVSLLVDGTFDFVDVRDVARGQILACEKGATGSRYILSGERISLEELFDFVRQMTLTRTIRVKVPFPLARFAAIFAPIYYRMTKAKPKFTSYSLETVISNSVISNRKAIDELGYQPRSLRETVVDTVQWWYHHLRPRWANQSQV